MAERCTVHRLPVEHLADAVTDPALAALLAEGWEVIGSLVVDAGAGKGPCLHLIMRPPRTPPAVHGVVGTLSPLVWVVLGAIVITGIVTSGVVVLLW